MRPTHMLRENWKHLQNPKRDSLWHHHLAGRVLLFSFPQLHLWECDTEGRGGGRGRTHLRGREGVFLPERCRAPQTGETPLHVAVNRGHAAVVEQLLAAGAAVDAGDKVRGEWGADRGGLGGRTQLCVSSWFSGFVLLKFCCYARFQDQQGNWSRMELCLAGCSWSHRSSAPGEEDVLLWRVMGLQCLRSGVCGRKA